MSSEDISALAAMSDSTTHDLKSSLASLATMSEDNLESSIIAIAASTTHNHECIVCHEKATLVCSGCKTEGGHTGPSAKSVWYCSADCQQKSWGDHKHLCKIIQTRKSFYKAVLIFQVLFCIVRDNIFLDSTLIWRLDTIPRLVVLRKGKIAGEITFPHMVTAPLGLTQAADINLILMRSYWCSLAAGFWAYSLIKNVLIRRGIVSKVTELVSITRISDGSLVAGLYPHIFIVKYLMMKVELANDGEVFALDFYRHELGDGTLITPWTDYMMESLPSGMSESLKAYKFHMKEITMEPKDFIFLQFMDESYITEDRVEEFRTALLLWETQQKTTLKKLLKMPSADIERQRGELATSIVLASIEFTKDNLKNESAVKESDEGRKDGATLISTYQYRHALDLEKI